MTFPIVPSDQNKALLITPCDWVSEEVSPGEREEGRGHATETYAAGPAEGGREGEERGGEGGRRERGARVREVRKKG